MSRAIPTPPPKKPKPTKRREFKFWLVMQLQAAGAQLTLESSYSEIKRAPERFEPFKADHLPRVVSDRAGSLLDNGEGAGT